MRRAQQTGIRQYAVVDLDAQEQVGPLQTERYALYFAAVWDYKNRTKPGYGDALLRVSRQERSKQ